MSRVLGPEAARSYQARVESGFIARYLSGDAVLDIGYRGGVANAQPITEKAIGVELDYPGYDGVRLPFDDCSQDAVFSSHCLEHIPDSRAVLADWYRVLKIGGYLVIAVPHQYLYERKPSLPSRFNRDHRRFYTPAALLAEVERALPLDGYRIRSLLDNDQDFDYEVPPEQHPTGCYEIELVIEKIARPTYGDYVGWAGLVEMMAKAYARGVMELARAEREGRAADRDMLHRELARLELPPFKLLEQHLGQEVDEIISKVMPSLVAAAPFDAAWYVDRYSDVRRIVADRGIGFAHRHYVHYGYYEARLPRPISPGNRGLYD